jgi:hypothetical protein
MAHHRKRHPEAKNNSLGTIATYQLVNNVIYHFSIDGMLLIGDDSASGYHVPEIEVAHYNVFGNYFKRSEISVKDHSEIAVTPGVRVYAGDNTYGNIGPFRLSSEQDPWDSVSFQNWNPFETIHPCPTDPYQVLTPFDPDKLPPYVTAQEAYHDVLNDVGANMGLNADGTFRDERDPVDLRIIADVRNNTGGFIQSPDDVGGWPEYGHGVPYPDEDGDGMSDEWELRYFGTLDRDGTGDCNGDGYTDLEEFLNGTDPTREIHDEHAASR